MLKTGRSDLTGIGVIQSTCEVNQDGPPLFQRFVKASFSDGFVNPTEQIFTSKRFWLCSFGRDILTHGHKRRVLLLRQTSENETM